MRDQMVLKLLLLLLLAIAPAIRSKDDGSENELLAAALLSLSFAKK